MMRMCEKSHPLGPPSESPLGNFESRRLLFEKGKRAPEHAFHRPGVFSPLTGSIPDPVVHHSPAQRGHFFPYPSDPIALPWLLPSALPVLTVARRCRSLTGRPAATTSSLARTAMRLPASSPWSAAAATPTRALFPWGNGLRAYHERATLAHIMWQRSLSVSSPPRPPSRYRGFASLKDDLDIGLRRISSPPQN